MPLCAWAMCEHFIVLFNAVVQLVLLYFCSIVYFFLSFSIFNLDLFRPIRVSVSSPTSVEYTVNRLMFTVFAMVPKS